MRSEASCVPQLEKSGVDVHCLDGRHAWQFPGLVRRLQSLLKTQSPQVLQSFLFHANIVGRIAARRAGVKVVLSGIRVAERHSHWHLWVDRLTQGRVDRYVCVSRSVADFTAKRGGISRKKIVVIPNGIDLDAYPAARPADLSLLGVPGGRKIVTFVGRLEPQKGVRWLVETAPAWLAELPDCDLLIVGDAPAGSTMRSELEGICQAKGIGGRVHFAGWRADVPEILAASTLLVLPSAWEGMPNVVLEAMASRLPVVATEVEGVAELLGVGTQTIPIGDATALGTRIIEFVRDTELAATTGRANREKAERDHGLSAMVAAYENLWETLAAG